MRIAWISYSFGEYCLRQVAALARDHDVLLAADAAEVGERRSLAGRAELYPFVAPRLRQPLRQARSILRIVARIRDFNPDVVHFQHGHLWFNLLGLPRLRDFPIVTTLHDPERHTGDHSSRKTPQWVMNRPHRMADRVIVHGKSLKSAAADTLGIAPERIDVVPHVAIGLPEKQQSVEEDPNCVLFFGRIWAYKGLRYLIEAAPLVAAAVPDVRFVVAGQGEDLAPYHALNREPARFEFINRWIGDDERCALFARAAVVALPYVEATQSGVTPVAYAHGKPVVASDVGALSECVRDGETGLLVPPRDPRRLADAIVDLLTDSARRRRLGEAGRQLVAGEWSPAAVATLTAASYARAIAGHQAIATHQRYGSQSSQPSHPSTS